MKTYDANTVSSTGAFLVGELERLDPTLNLPLASVTWGRDIELREDVSISDESTSFTNTAFAAAGGASNTGKNWIGSMSNVIAGIAMGIDKTVLPVRLWGMELGYSIVELEKALKLGRPIDAQKLEGIRLKHNMDIDEMVYIGDEQMGATGLLNNADIDPADITSEWDEETDPKVILTDINGVIETTWKQTGYAVCPDTLLLPPAKFALLLQPVTTAGSESILSYIKKNALSFSINGKPIEINPLKWLTGRGVGETTTDRMVAYSKSKQYVRFPMVPLQRTPLEFRGLQQLCIYFGALGEMEFVYPETVGYGDGL